MKENPLNPLPRFLELTPEPHPKTAEPSEEKPPATPESPPAVDPKTREARRQNWRASRRSMNSRAPFPPPASEPDWDEV